MKFEEAFDKVFDRMKDDARKTGRNFAVSPDTAKIMAYMWNMMVLSKNKLDDEFVFIDNSNNIVSLPWKGETDGKKPKEEKKVANESKKAEEAVINEIPKSAESREDSEI